MLGHGMERLSMVRLLLARGANAAHRNDLDVRPRLYRETPRKARRQDMKEFRDAFISQLHEAHHLSDRGSHNATVLHGTVVEQDRTVLHGAVFGQGTQIARTLIDGGADVNSADDNGTTLAAP